MRNLGKIAAALAGLTAAFTLSLNVAAQETANPFPGQARLLDRVGAAKVSELLADYRISTALAPYDGGEAARITARTEGGAQFLVILRQCDDVVAASGCQQIVFTTAMSNSGVSFDELNDFNGNAAVTKAVNLADQQVVVFGLQMFLQGGVGAENIKTVVGLFMLDMHNYVTSANSAVAVSMDQSSPAPAATADAAAKISKFGAAADGLASPLMIEYALSSAIANTTNVRFWTGDPQ